MTKASKTATSGNVKQWQLPSGVTRGLWDYTHSPHIATTYDEYFEYHSLLKLDLRIVQDSLSCGNQELIADLGCGTGRALVPLVRAGARGLAVDLSEHMLVEVRRKADMEDLPIECLLANLVNLECLADGCVDHAICLFSTLGMIQQHANRVRAVRHMRRIIKPGGRLVIHVHNYWAHLFDPGGLFAIARNLIESRLSSRTEQGDRYFPYRGVPKMFLHSFTERELRQLLESNGFRRRQFHPLNETQSGLLQLRWLLRWIRASGWIVVCQ
jgi:SAM-dependent methyltransferase